MKNIEIQKLNENIGKLKTKKLPIKLALIISRNAHIIEDAAADIEEQRLEIIRRYAERDEKGEVKIDEKGNAKISDVTALSEDFKELFEAELDLKFETVSEEEIQKCDEDKYDSLTLDEVSILTFMIEG